MTRWLLAVGVLGGLAVPAARADDAELREQAAKALRKAVEYFRKDIATEGGYLWRYSEDLARREGERQATATQVWVQPPGTPSVGIAYLAASEATGDAYYLEAARETAHALVKGQLRSGGWDYVIEFDPKLRPKHAYRADGGTTGRNVSTLDDNTTQHAVRLLMRVDRALAFKDAKIHEAAAFALERLLEAQYPNGAWPQRFERPPDPTRFPVKKASYPESWPRTWPNVTFTGYYTLNDNTIADTIDIMLEASRLYDQPKYRAAAEKGGGFFLLAQMPEPQPGWAQQYDADMHPSWARRFEPAAITGGEAQGAMRTLLQLYRETGDKKYLEPLPRALDYYQRSRLSDGRLARFYELHTNQPLYFTRDYQLTYKDDDLPTHYAFKVGDTTAQIRREYERLKALSPAELKPPAKPSRPTLTKGLTEQTKAVLGALDDRGRWVEAGRLRTYGPDDSTRRVLNTQTFIRNIETLAAFLKASAP